MKNVFSPNFFLIFVAIGIWVPSALLSTYFQEELLRKNNVSPKESSSALAPSGTATATLSRKLAEDPKNNVLRLELAEAYISEAYRTQNTSLVMSAVKEFRGVLDAEPENPRALLGLAKLCFENGLLDLASDFYPRYLKQVPEDKAARNDYSLVLLELGNGEEAKTNMIALVKDHPDYTPALFSLAYVYTRLGDIDAAKAQAETALSSANDEETRLRISDFISNLENGSFSEEAKSVENSLESLSPAAMVAKFFKEHQILGPKLSKIKWPDVDSANIYLKDFPISQMPEFAQAKLKSRIENFFSALSEEITLNVFIDGEEVPALTYIVGANPREGAP